jgi:hypothetical protein
MILFSAGIAGRGEEVAYAAVPNGQAACQQQAHRRNHDNRGSGFRRCGLIQQKLFDPFHFYSSLRFLGLYFFAFCQASS